MTCLRLIGVGTVLLAATMLSGCSTASPRFTPRGSISRESAGVASHQLVGIASYYADEFHGRTTSNGEIYDMHALTAAHKTLPFNTRVRVHNLENNKTIIVRVNDRGPFKDDRVIDVSLAAAKQLGLIASGTAQVKLEILEFGSDAR